MPEDLSPEFNGYDCKVYADYLALPMHHFGQFICVWNWCTGALLFQLVRVLVPSPSSVSLSGSASPPKPENQVTLCVLLPGRIAPGLGHMEL